MSTKGEVVNGKLDVGGMMGAAGCHHTSIGAACGGCYLRLSNAIDEAKEALEGSIGESEEDKDHRIYTAQTILETSIYQRLAEKRGHGDTGLVVSR